MPMPGGIPPKRKAGKEGRPIEWVKRRGSRHDGVQLGVGKADRLDVEDILSSLH